MTATVPRSIPALLEGTAERYGELPAVVDGDLTLSYEELVEQSGTFAAALVAAGFEVGDRASIWLFNSAQWIVAMLGVSSAGGVLVPINTRFKGGEAAVILGRSRASVLVTTTEFLGINYLAMLAAADADLPDLRVRVVATGAAPAGSVSWDSFMVTATPEARAEVDRRCRVLESDDLSDILFTSGTTGVPKGVVMTHGRTLSVATDWVAMTGLIPGDRYLMVNPYFHMFGFKAGILASVAAGATMLPEPTFDVDRVLTRVAAEQVTVLPGPPTLYQSLLDHPDRAKHDVSSLRVAVTGSADIPIGLIRRVFDELPFPTIVSGYGLTEAGTANSTGLGDDPEAIATTVGGVRPGFEMRVVNETGDDLPNGEAGEVLLRGPSVMSHYLDDPDATVATLSSDGWLRTGDIGVIDAAKRLRIVGRAKDMFIVGGFNAYPAEIENAMLGHPQIASAAVIGIPDNRLGEVGMAFVVLNSGADTGEPQIIEWCRAQMANYKVPRVIEIVDALPLNATGKVMKDELRERAAARTHG
jgi:acyl-CoA synthetase (AMP-forming)/AMP-acid ligase II